VSVYVQDDQCNIKKNITECTFDIFVFWLYKTSGGISTLFVLYNSYPFINNFSKQININ